jgi:dihydrofolate reductase
MPKVKLDISMSLDGFVAGPDRTIEEPLGERGELLHEWVFGLQAWRERHGLEGGETNVDSKVLEESMANAGAVVMGRRMFSGGHGSWDADPRAHGWWGDEPPFGVPVFVLTHHARQPLAMAGGTTFTFVTEGIEAAIEQARDAAGGRDVNIGGGASVAQQALAAGLLDELQIHIAPLLLGGGVRLFEGFDAARVGLEQTRAVEGQNIAHITYRAAAGQ